MLRRCSNDARQLLRGVGRFDNAVAGRKAVWPFMENDRVKPAIESTYRLLPIPCTLSRTRTGVESGDHVGKVVLAL